MHLARYVQILQNRARSFRVRDAQTDKRRLPDLLPEVRDRAREMCREGHSLRDIQIILGLPSYDQIQKCCSGLKKTYKSKSNERT